MCKNGLQDSLQVCRVCLERDIREIGLQGAVQANRVSAEMPVFCRTVRNYFSAGAREAGHAHTVAVQ